jgi:hypothetical protein
MRRTKPLARFPIVATNRIEEAEVAITRSLTDVSVMRVADRDRFEMQMNAVNIGRTALVFNRFGTGCKVKARLDDMFAFVIGGDTPSTFDLDCGFINLGRFSQVYRRRFGERPSDTLRKGR